MTRIELDDGKYTVVHDSGAGLHALRYGEHWRDMTGDGLVLAMAQEIEDLRRRIVPVQQVSVPDGSTKMQWPEIVALVNEVLGCEAHKYPCERGSIGHEMTGINFNSLARIIDRVHRLAAAPAAPAADAGLVEALEKLARLGNGDKYGNSDGNLIAQAALAAHRAKGVV